MSVYRMGSLGLVLIILEGSGMRNVLMFFSGLTVMATRWVSLSLNPSYELNLAKILREDILCGFSRT